MLGLCFVFPLALGDPLILSSASLQKASLHSVLSSTIKVKFIAWFLSAFLSLPLTLTLLVLHPNPSMMGGLEYHEVLR